MAAGAMWVTFDAALKGPRIWEPGDTMVAGTAAAVGSAAAAAAAVAAPAVVGKLEPEQELPSMLQLVVVGDGDVGCSAFVEQWVRKRFRGDGADSAAPGIAAEGTAAACSGTCRQIKVDARPVLVLFWDVGSDERSESCSAVYSQADAVLVLYDVGRRDTFDSVAGWVGRARSNCRSSLVPVAVVGTRVDLPPRPPPAGAARDGLAGAEARVTEEEAWALAERLGTLHFRTSSKTGQMVNEAVNRVVEDALTFVMLPAAEPLPPEWAARRQKKKRVLAGLPRSSARSAEAAVESLLQQKSLISASPRRRDENMWEHDDDTPRCGRCKDSFNLVRRRHHCRMCGLLFCHPCSDRTFELESSASSPSSAVGSSEGPPSVQHERVCIGCHTRLQAEKRETEEEEQRREREVEETVKRLSALQAATGFFPDEDDDENCTPKALVSFVQQYADEAFLVQHGLNDNHWRARTASWAKPQALQLYHGLLQRYRDFDAADEAAAAAAAEAGGEDVEVAVYKYSSDEDSDGSDSEIIEFVTPRVRADDGTAAVQANTHMSEGGGSEPSEAEPASDNPRASWIQPAYGSHDGEAGQGGENDDGSAAGAVLRRHRVQLSSSDGPAELRPVHVRHAEAAQSNLAALHWKLLREDRTGANLESGASDECPDAAEVRRTLELLQWEIASMKQDQEQEGAAGQQELEPVGIARIDEHGGDKFGGEEQEVQLELELELCVEEESVAEPARTAFPARLVEQPTWTDVDVDG